MLDRRTILPGGSGVLLAAMLWIAAPGSARAASADDGAAPRLVMPDLASVRPGETVRIQWTQAGSAVDELELQLSLDGGRHFTLRISPELDARAGEFLWRVPNLASAEARVRLRFQRDGREVEGDVSAPFRIEFSAAIAAERALVHEGTWWTGDLEVPGAGEALKPPAERLAALDLYAANALAPRAPAAPELPRARLAGESGTHAAADPAPPSDRAPSGFRPLRI